MCIRDSHTAGPPVTTFSFSRVAGIITKLSRVAGTPQTALTRLVEEELQGKTKALVRQTRTDKQKNKFILQIILIRRIDKLYFDTREDRRQLCECCVFLVAGWVVGPS